MFQSLIWVACPTGPQYADRRMSRSTVSIPHMGCMPYGRSQCILQSNADRVSIPHMGCMPYGHWYLGHTTMYKYSFQSLIWVACPTGRLSTGDRSTLVEFQSLIWVACPTGVSSKGNPARTLTFQSLIWVACPTGSTCCVADGRWQHHRFNPSYGLHALRALKNAYFLFF